MAKGFHHFNWVLRSVAVALSILTLSAKEPLAYRPGRLIVQPKAGAEKDLDSFQKRKKHRLKNKFEHLGGIQIVDVDPSEDSVAVAKEYQDSGLVAFAEPDYIIRASTVPTDPDFSRAWSLQKESASDTDATFAWDVRTNAENVIVAVIDSGVRYTHEDLAANMWVNPREQVNSRDDDRNGFIDDIHGCNAYDASGDPMDDNGHGTHVAGIIGAVANNGKGIAGVCWKVKIMACKFMGPEGEGDTSDAITCINYARLNGARVINASWGSGYGSYALRSAISSARSAGIVFVTAAGNEKANNDLYPSYPANYPLDNIVSVAATDRSGTLDPYYSNYGAKTVDLAAPGTAIYSTWNESDSTYMTLSGTSMASPHVAGAVALLRAAYPSETYLAIIKRLYDATDKMPSLTGKCVTGGRLNIGNLFPHAEPTNEVPIVVLPVVTNIPPVAVETNLPPAIETNAPPIVQTNTPPVVDIPATNPPPVVDVPVTNTPPVIDPVIPRVALPSLVLSTPGVLHLPLPESTEDYELEKTTDFLTWQAVPLVHRAAGLDITVTDERWFFRLRASSGATNAPIPQAVLK